MSKRPRSGKRDVMALSVVLPAYNEADNLRELLPELISRVRGLGMTFELVIVDDGSTDGTRGAIHDLLCPEIYYVRLRRNAGKSAALSAGLARAAGEIIVFMDADGQDDPGEIPRLVAALGNGFDIVSGRRLQRRDRFVKRMTSKFFNAVTGALTGVRGKDLNTGLKAMRRGVAESLVLYGELHRYVPVLAVWSGFRFDEIDVVHRPRRHGSTKFGVTRFLRGFLDLVTVKFLTTYTARPLHLFGAISVVLGAAGTGLLSWMLALRIAGEGIGNRPALLAGVLLVVVAVQMLSLGLLAELSVWLSRRRIVDLVEEDSRGP